MIRREVETGERGTICVKKLDLVTVTFARSVGLYTDKPVFTSLNDSELLIYRLGDTVRVAGSFDSQDIGPILAVEQSKVAIFHTGVEQLSDAEVVYGGVIPRPRVGISYNEISKLAMVYGNNNWSSIKAGNWVAIVEPLGRLLTEDDPALPFNRVTDELRVNEMMVFCEVSDCHAGPLKEGSVIDSIGSGFLFAFCNSKKHAAGVENHPEWFTPHVTFEVNRFGEIIFNESS